MPRWLVRVGLGLLGIGALIGATVIADLGVRMQMERVAREEIAIALRLDDPNDVEAEIDGGSAIVQLLLGSVDHVAITVDDLDLGVADGTFHAEIYDLPTNPLTPIPRAYSYITLDHESVVQLTGDFVDAPVVDVALEPPALRVELEVTLPGRSTPTDVTVIVEPVMRGSRVVLVPQSIEVGAARLEPADFEQRFGVPTSELFEQTGFCVADSVPATMEIADVRVSNGAVLLVFAIEQRSVLQLQSPHGTCVG